MEKKKIASLLFLAFASIFLITDNIISFYSLKNSIHYIASTVVQECRIGKTFIYSPLAEYEKDKGLENLKKIGEKKIKEAKKELKKLNNKKYSKKKWFKKYKSLQEKYKPWVDSSQTIYDIFSKQELYLLFSIVEAEVTGKGYFIEKTHVASVIFNRLFDKRFDNTLTEILTSPRQFSTYSNGRYADMKIINETKLACEYAWQIEDTANGALYFDSTDGNSYASGNKKFLFRDDVGHDFYK